MRERQERKLSGEDALRGEEDRGLITRVRAGDDSALRALMQRYDRLVRYHVFRLSRERCFSDPEWLDTVSADVWTAFVQRIRNHPNELERTAAMLTILTRNKTVSALRLVNAVQTERVRGGESNIEEEVANAEELEPAAVLARIEDLDALQSCIQALSEVDRRIFSQLKLILDKKWGEAGKVLDVPESTLRSRWKTVLEQLRACLQKKTGRDFAPEGESGDSLR